MKTANKGNGKTNFKIWCETEEIKNKVLKEMEKQGFRWHMGQIATGFNPTSPCALYVENKCITFAKSRSYFSEHRYVEINAFEYLSKHKNECIVIYRKGQEVIALDKVTGKKAVAKCSPDDEFDFNIGSKLAFERLLGIEQPKYKEVKRLAKKGEYVKVVKEIGTHGGEYKVGDILEIVKVLGCYACYEDRLGRILYLDEYVVLEGYEPPKEEKKEGFFKVLCIKEYRSSGNLAFKKGKVYEYRDGFCRREDGFVSGYYPSYENLLAQNVSYRDCLVELKEGDDPDEIMKQYTFFNGKVVCTCNDGNHFSLTVGKIYEFKEGIFYDDDGDKRPLHSKPPVKTLDEYHKQTKSRFVEIVE